MPPFRWSCGALRYFRDAVGQVYLYLLGDCPLLKPQSNRFSSRFGPAWVSHFLPHAGQDCSWRLCLESLPSIGNYASFRERLQVNSAQSRVTELKDELAALSKKHVEELQSAIYVGMNEQEGAEYDQSRARINELYGLLSRVGPSQDS